MGLASGKHARAFQRAASGLLLLAFLVALSACSPAGGAPSTGMASAGAKRTPTAQLEAPTVAATIAPSPTIATAACGAWSGANGSTGQPVAATYGALSNCELVGDAWLLATQGLSGKPGVIGVDTCHGDAACLNPQTDRGMSAWRFFAAPYVGGVRILGAASPGVMIVDNGGRQLRFTIATGAWGS